MKIAIAILLLTGIFVSYTNNLQLTKYAFIHERKTIDTVIQQTGIVYKMGTTNEPLYIIRCANKYLNFFPANLPAHCKQDLAKITFSGAMKYTHPMEDEYGQFFVVSEIINT